MQEVAVGILVGACWGGEVGVLPIELQVSATCLTGSRARFPSSLPTPSTPQPNLPSVWLCRFSPMFWVLVQLKLPSPPARGVQCTPKSSLNIGGISTWWLKSNGPPHEFILTWSWNETKMTLHQVHVLPIGQHLYYILALWWLMKRESNLFLSLSLIQWHHRATLRRLYYIASSLPQLCTILQY